MYNDLKSEPKILMLGPGREVRGGVTTVVNSYFELGLDGLVSIKYIVTMLDGSYLKKLLIACKAYLQFCFCIKYYDIVHVHMAAQASFFRKSIFIKKAFKSKKKIIIHSHAADFNSFYDKQSNEKQKQYIKQIFSMADKVIVLSEEWADFFGKEICSPEKLIILYNGVTMPDYEKTDYTDHNILFLGRLGMRKGIYDLLKAIPKIVEQIPDAMFYIGGDGDINNCRTIAERENITDHVKFLGWVKGREKEEYLKQCSVFTLPSYHEGMPMSVLEAMSYGLAVVTTNVGGIPQIIDDGINGIKIKSGDVLSIQSNIIELLKNSEYKKRIAQCGHNKVCEHFNIEQNINKLDEIYYKLTSESYLYIPFHHNLEKV